MSTDPKSLAAEIEALLNKHLVIVPGEDWPVLIGVPKAAAEIAALQSRAFEDGARWMRDEALAAARPWMVVVTPDPTSKTPRSHKAISSGLYEAIAALQPEGERSDA